MLRFSGSLSSISVKKGKRNISHLNVKTYVEMQKILFLNLNLINSVTTTLSVNRKYAELCETVLSQEIKSSVDVELVSRLGGRWRKCSGARYSLGKRLQIFKALLNRQIRVALISN